MNRSGMTTLATAAALALVAGCTEQPGVSPDVALTESPVQEARGAMSSQTGGVDDGHDGWLVLYKDGVSPTDVRASAMRMSSKGVDVAFTLRSAAGFVVRGDKPDVSGEENVEGVYLNTRFYKLFQSNATYYRRGWQWDMRQMRADQVPSSIDGSGVVVCIIDGGVATSHQDLSGKVIGSASFNAGQGWGPEIDTDSHGSHVGSAITSNGIGMASIAPGARLLNANVFGPNAGTSVAQIVDAMNWCRTNNADIINMSLGGGRTRGTAAWVSDSTLYTNTTNTARNAGVVVIAAAGNSNTAIPGNSAFVPAEATNVLSVGVTAPPTNAAFPFSPNAPNASFDTRAGYSNFHSGNFTLGAGVRVWAPGGANVVRNALNTTGVCNPEASDFANGCVGGRSYIFYSGTSMAAPRAAGVAALITQRFASPKNLARAERVEACLLNTGDALPNASPFFGRPRVNALNAATAPC